MLIHLDPDSLVAKRWRAYNFCFFLSMIPYFLQIPIVGSYVFIDNSQYYSYFGFGFILFFFPSANIIYRVFLQRRGTISIIWVCYGF
mmetsp:Transcript_31333/g.27687  ORF Transcript_31333/g.27687 Transcript_31333/m.27687 type:complete len:87 (+) Transcript_31333:39-299(+)